MGTEVITDHFEFKHWESLGGRGEQLIARRNNDEWLVTDAQDGNPTTVKQIEYEIPGTNEPWYAAWAADHKFFIENGAHGGGQIVDSFNYIDWDRNPWTVRYDVKTGMFVLTPYGQ